MAARYSPKAAAAGGPVGFVCGRGMRKSVLYSLGLITRAQMAFTRLFMPMAFLVLPGKRIYADGGVWRTETDCPG